MKQCWLSVKWTRRNIFQLIYNKNTIHSIKINYRRCVSDCRQQHGGDFYSASWCSKTFLTHKAHHRIQVIPYITQSPYTIIIWYGTPSFRVDGAEQIRKSYGKKMDRRPSLDGNGKSNASAILCNGVLANQPFIIYITSYYRQGSNIRRTKSQLLQYSRTLLQLSL